MLAAKTDPGPGVAQAPQRPAVMPATLNVARRCRQSRATSKPFEPPCSERSQKRDDGGQQVFEIKLRREGFTDNHKRICRVCREEGLRVPMRKNHKAVLRRGGKPDFSRSP